MRFRGGSRTEAEERLRDYARVLVRSGLQTREELVADLETAVAEELGEPGDPGRPGEGTGLATRLAEEAAADLQVEQAGWPEPTDYERIQLVFAELEQVGVVVLQGVDDHWAATELLEQLDDEGLTVRGVAWFTAPDVWHAIDHGMLEVNLWHGDTANVAPGDVLLDQAVALFEAQGLPAHFDEGRIEVSAHWQRRR